MATDRAMVTGQDVGPCELCGAVEDRRPYGPGGKRICFGCGVKDPDATVRAAAERMGTDLSNPTEVAAARQSLLEVGNRRARRARAARARRKEA